MARKKTQRPAEDMTATADGTAIVQATAAHDELHQHLATIDAEYGDGLPYDTQRIINETRFYLQQSAEAMLEAGRRLVLLKEHEPRGEFLAALDSIGIPHRTAQKMMQAAIKFSDAPTLAHLGKSKMFELMTEDDEEIQALAEGGTLAGHTIDEIDRMSVRELKAALRDERERAAQERETTEAMLNSKNRKIDELDQALHRRENATLDERITTLSAALERATTKTLGALLGPQQVIQEIIELEEAPQHLRDAGAQALNRIRTALDEAQERLGVVDMSAQPGEDEWMTAVEEA